MTQPGQGRVIRPMILGVFATALVATSVVSAGCDDPAPVIPSLELIAKIARNSRSLEETFKSIRSDDVLDRAAKNAFCAVVEEPAKSRPPTWQDFVDGALGVSWGDLSQEYERKLETAFSLVQEDPSGAIVYVRTCAV